ncbi:hypothetical protein H0H81_011398 [Sphagnurus paluster]|uniref:Uncharacterized protein n=1 Tax=Sphagnurus paluster TaxID=117069 RepID=A0A9P7GII8_9AGAR|nr:hypothetical protein H0H81_011398 [Sphagnurus paluster]
MDPPQDLLYREETPLPRYPGCDVYASTQPNQSHLPSFDQVMTLYEYEDSIRLPTYQTRPLRRYHPYWRVRPVTHVCDEITRYHNTVFDESYELLEVPSLNVPAVPTLPQAADLDLVGDNRAQQIADQLELLIPPAPLGPPPLPPTPALVEPGEDEVAMYAGLDMQEQHLLRIHHLWHLLVRLADIECPMFDY